MENRYYLYGKCIFSYDDDIFSSDAYHELIVEEFIYPIADNVYKKYYEKQLVQQALEDILKENDIIFQAYNEIKPLIENEKMSVAYILDDDETLFKRLMREKLNADDFSAFEKLMEKAGIAAWNKEMDFLMDQSCMIEHFWCE